MYTHTYKHTHIHINMYMCMCFCICVCIVKRRHAYTWDNRCALKIESHDDCDQESHGVSRDGVSPDIGLRDDRDNESCEVTRLELFL